MTAPQPVNNPAIVWTRFLVAFARLLATPMREEAAYRGEAFNRWRDLVLDQLGSDATSAALATEFRSLLGGEGRMAADLMLEELDAFTTYVERLTGTPIAPDTTYPETTQYDRPAREPGEVKEGLGVGKIIIDSLKNLLDKLPFSLKALLEAASELAGMAGLFR